MDKSRRLRLYQMEIFVEVARHKSVSRAATSLHLTQPAVTRTLRELEAICGADLVAKDGRGIRITHHGETFLRHAGASLVAARTGLSAVANLGSSAKDLIRIGALPTVSATVMPSAVKSFLETGLRNRLKITTGENRVLLDQLRNGELDLVMGRLPAPENMTGLSFDHLYRDKVVFAVHRTHPLAGRESLSVNELVQWSFLMPPADSIISPFVQRLMIEQGIAEPAQVVETVSDSFGRAFAREHHAIWIISRGVIASDIARGEMITLPLDTSTTLGSVGLCLKDDRPIDPATMVFIGILRVEAEKLANKVDLNEV